MHEHDLAVDSPSCGSKCGCNGAELEFADMKTGMGLVVDCKEETELADMGCVLARSCDSCTHESEKVGLADMGCVLARGCDSCTHESGFSESEVADMGCVLARGCDSCTHESGFSVRAHDWFDDHSEVSVEQQVEPYLKFLRPLL